MAVEPAPGAVTEDRLLGGRVRLRQPAAGYRAAIDPVLLAAACPAVPGERALDLGCGVGAAMLCLGARVPDLTLDGVEIDPWLAELARANLALNGARGAVTVADVAAFRPEGRYAVALINPPFHPPDADPSPDPRRARATIDTDLAPWIAAARRALAPKGRLALIQRADRLPQALAALARGFGGIEILPLWPRAGGPAKRVILRARAGSRAAASLLPGLVLHDGDGLTAAARAALEDAGAL